MELAFSKGFPSRVWSIKDGISYVGEFQVCWMTDVDAAFFLRNPFWPP